MTIRVRVVFALVVVVLAGACARGNEQAAPTATATASASSLEEAHDFTLETFDGDTFTLSDHFGELPVVLNFWAPW